MIKVLDHGYVRLVDHLGDDLAVLRAARASGATDDVTGQDPTRDQKLIAYLLSHRHTSPFEHVVFTFEVKAPLFVLRQWHRHRTWSYNEVSARYTELPQEFFSPSPESIGEQSTSNRQGRALRELDETERAEVARQVDRYRASCQDSFRVYGNLLRAGWPRELARACLPVSTYSRMYATVDLHNLLHFLSLRLDTHAQPEIRVYGEAIVALIEPIVPWTLQAWRSLR